MRAWLLTIGGIAVLGQVVLLRELHVAAHGSELVYVLALGIWLAWTASGAALGRRGATPPAAGVAWLLLAFGPLLLADVVWIRGMRRVLGGVPGADLALALEVAGALVALAPIGIALGLLFQWAARHHVVAGRTLAGAYAIESLGGALGGVVATFAVMIGLGNVHTALLCGVAAALSVVILGTDRRSLPAAAVLAVLPGLLLPWAGVLDARLTAWEHPLLLATRDTPYGRITVTGAGGQVSLFENGALIAENEGTDAEEFVHLVCLQHPAPRAVLILGGAFEGLEREVRLHGVERIDLIEIDRAALDLALEHLPAPDLVDAGHAPPVTRLVIDDPRRFVERTAVRYDVILIGASSPSSAQANRYFTREFFASCARRLAPGGVLGVRLRLATNVWTPLLEARAMSVARAMQQALGHVMLLPGDTDVLLGSVAPLPDDWRVPAARLAERRIHARQVSPAYVRYVYENDRRQETRRLLDRDRSDAVAGRRLVNLDARPIAHAYTLLIELSRQVPSLMMMRPPSCAGARSGARPVVGGLALLGVFVVARRWWGGRRLLLAGVAGLVGMMLESVWILGYQIRSGILYQDIGLLLTAFMLGLAAGAAGVRRLSDGRTGGRAATHDPARPGAGAIEHDAPRLAPRWGALWMTGLALLSAVTALQLAAGHVAGLVGTVTALGLAGALVAAVFAHASMRRIERGAAARSGLYAADLAGGALGAVAGGLLVVPFCGLDVAAWMMAALATAALLLV